MADTNDEIRPVASRELPAGDTQNAAGVSSLVAAQVEIDRAVALNTAKDEDVEDSSNTQHEGHAWRRIPWLRPPRARGMQRSGRGAKNVCATMIQELPRLHRPRILLAMLHHGSDCKLTLQRVLQSLVSMTQQLGLNSVAGLLSTLFGQKERAPRTMKRHPAWKGLLGRRVFALLRSSL